MSLVKTKFELKIVYGEGAKYDELDYKEGVVYFCTDTDGEYKGIIILNDIKYGSTENDSTEGKDIEALQKEIASLGAELDEARDSIASALDEIAAFSSRIDTVEGNITDITSELSDHSTYIAELKDGVTVLNSDIVSLTDTVNGKQDALTAGTGIAIEDNVVSVTLDTTLYKVVTALPEAPDAEDENKIFLIEAENEDEGNVFVEYLWVNSAWEKIGEESAADIDLSNYVTKDELNEYATKVEVNETVEAIQSDLDKLTTTVQTCNYAEAEAHSFYKMTNTTTENRGAYATVIFMDNAYVGTSGKMPDVGEMISLYIPSTAQSYDAIALDKVYVGYIDPNYGGANFAVNTWMPVYTTSPDYAIFEGAELYAPVVTSDTDNGVQYFDESIWKDRGINMLLQNIGGKLLWLNPPTRTDASTKYWREYYCSELQWGSGSSSTVERGSYIGLYPTLTDENGKAINPTLDESGNLVSIWDEIENGEQFYIYFQDINITSLTSMYGRGGLVLLNPTAANSATEDEILKYKLLANGCLPSNMDAFDTGGVSYIGNTGTNSMQGGTTVLHCMKLNNRFWCLNN